MDLPYKAFPNNKEYSQTDHFWTVKLHDLTIVKRAIYSFTNYSNYRENAEFTLHCV